MGGVQVCKVKHDTSVRRTNIQGVRTISGYVSLSKSRF